MSVGCMWTPEEKSLCLPVSQKSVGKANALPRTTWLHAEGCPLKPELRELKREPRPYLAEAGLKSSYLSRAGRLRKEGKLGPLVSVQTPQVGSGPSGSEVIGEAAHHSASRKPHTGRRARLLLPPRPGEHTATQSPVRRAREGFGKQPCFSHPDAPSRWASTAESVWKTARHTVPHG